jgi:hypothetical protein
MTTSQIIELAAAVLLIGGGVRLYRRRGREDHDHGSQGAVIMLIIGAILAIHGLGLLAYHPMRLD